MSSKNPLLLFEKFEVLETLKKDEFSAVYLVKHHFLATTLILKTLDTTHSPDDSILERFKREAKILARIKHPNIINVVDFGYAGQFFYISVEYFQSENLRDFLKQQQLSDEQKQLLIIQLLRGLEAAHNAQIIHRDIKPENILVNKNFELKIADFGLAFPENELLVTQKSSIVGTPSYMSPEQIMGESLTAQSDLFSAGIVAYEICTKANPFIKADINATINSILSFDVDQLNGWDAVPADCRDLIKRMLQRSKTKRLVSCAEALAYFPESITIPVQKEAKTPKKNLLSVIVAFTVLLIAVLYFAVQYRASGTIHPDTAAVPDTNSARQEAGSKENLPAKQGETPEGKTQSVVPETAAPVKEDFYLVNLIVDCSPWANVAVDSMKLDVTPIRQSLRLTAGKHVIRFTHPDYPVYSANFTVDRDGVQAFKVNMDTLVAKVNFQVFPWGQVYVDGKFFGDTPMKNAILLSPGKHVIVIKNPGYADFSANYVFKRGESKVIEYNFDKNK